MMFDDIQEVNAPTYEVKDWKKSIESVKEMQGGFRAAKGMCRGRAEHTLVDRLIELSETIEVLLNAFPPAGIYRKID